MTLSLHRLITRVSVRVRIIVLAAIPVIGFLVNGIAFTVGEHEVAHAFRTADQASDLAEISREFRGALVAMRIRTRDFIVRSDQDAVHAFETAHDTRGPHAGHHRGSRRRADPAQDRAAEEPARGNRRAVRRPRAQSENPGLQRNRRHPRPHDQGGGRGRAHHPWRHVVDDRSGRAQAPGYPADDAPLRGRIPAEPLDAWAIDVFPGVREVPSPHSGSDRRWWPQNGAGGAGQDLQRHLRRMDRVQRQGRSAGRGDRIQRQEHDSDGRRHHPLGQGLHRRRRCRAGRLPGPDPSHHHRRRHCGRADRARIELADRPQHRPAAQRPWPRS